MRCITMSVVVAVVMGLVGCGGQSREARQDHETEVMMKETRASPWQTGKEFIVIETQPIKGTTLKRVIFYQGNEMDRFAAFASRHHEKGAKIEVVETHAQQKVGWHHIRNLVVKED